MGRVVFCVFPERKGSDTFGAELWGADLAAWGAQRTGILWTGT